MIETIPLDREKEKAVLSDLEARYGIDPRTAKAILSAVGGPDEARVQSFLTPVGTNDERGFKKFCPECNDYTGHLALPGSAWYFERCLRCRRISVWQVLISRLPPFGKAVVMPDMDAKAVLRLVLTVAGPEYFARCFELWLKEKVAERERVLLADMKERAAQESRVLRELSSL